MESKRIVQKPVDEAIIYKRKNREEGEGGFMLNFLITL